MPVALFPEALQSAATDKTALPGILEEEENWAQEANRERQLQDRKWQGLLPSPAGA